MSDILELEFRKQKSKRYDNRYVVDIVTELYFYELVYRSNGGLMHLSLSRETYGKIHERKNSFVDVENNPLKIIEHAKETVLVIEKRSE
ncbi:MAG: hypothetical protein H8Z69_01415 [Nanohaloarchaea archaeon]|nr:hypothetical protein [Candidatus Nanohaloarchaea archaeon]